MVGVHDKHGLACVSLANRMGNGVKKFVVERWKFSNLYLCSLDFEIGESQKDSYWMIGASLIPYGIL